MYFETQSDCSIGRIAVYYKASCDTYTNSAISVSISAVTGKSQNLVTGAAETVAIVMTGSGPFVYSLTVTPTPNTPGLITIDGASGSITFAASSNPADANTVAISDLFNH